MLEGLTEIQPSGRRGGGDGSQVDAEIDDESLHVLQPALGERSNGAVAEFLELTVENGELAGHDREPLQRPIVDVEAESRDAPLGRLEQLLSGTDDPLEQHAPVEDRADGAHHLARIGESLRDPARPGSDGWRPAPPPRRADRGAGRRGSAAAPGDG